MSRDALQRLHNIESACAKIVRHTEDHGRDEVFADEPRFDGVLLNLHSVGEAVKGLPEDLPLPCFDSPRWRITDARTSCSGDR